MSFIRGMNYHPPFFAIASTAADRWNGNISEWVWQQGTASSQTYRFAYDGVNRLTSALSTGNYNEKGITYDKNGNIKTMQRNAGSSTTMVDNLTYTYTGNRLTGLNEAIRTAPSTDVFAPGSAAAGSYT